MKKQTILTAAAGALLAILCMALGWGAKQIEIGSSTIGDSGSLINSLGITNGVLTLSPTTNMITFAGTNTAPNSTTLVRWISVQISGETTAYRIGLAQ